MLIFSNNQQSTINLTRLFQLKAMFEVIMIDLPLIDEKSEKILANLSIFHKLLTMKINQKAIN